MTCKIMKIVDFETFNKMPAGTVFAPFEPCVTKEDFQIKFMNENNNEKLVFELKDLTYSELISLYRELIDFNEYIDTTINEVSEEGEEVSAVEPVNKQALEDVALEFDDIQNEFESDVNATAFDESELFDDLDE